jgi:hypothetical protein
MAIEAVIGADLSGSGSRQDTRDGDLVDSDGEPVGEPCRRSME